MQTSPASRSGRPTQVRALRTRDALLAAAALVFDRLGYSATRLEDVAIEADATKGALYFHFRSKADLANAIVEAQNDRCAALAAESQEWGLNGLETLERFMLELARYYQLD